MAKLREIYRSRIAQFPGLWLNMLAILLAAAFVFSSYRAEIGQQSEKCRAAKDSMNSLFAEYLAGTRNILAVESHIHQDIHLLFHDNPEEGLIYHPPEDDVEEFIRQINIKSYLVRLTVSNKDLLITDLVGKFQHYRYSRSVFAKNFHIYLGWGICALIYAVLVCFAYFGRAASPENAEPLLNIVDIGLLLALVEYSGGLQSRVCYLLAFSVAVAGFEIVRAYRSSGIPTWSKLRLAGPQSVAAYIPTTLYFFSLLTGLAWASIDNARESHLSMSSYFSQYAQAVGLLLLLALVIATTVHLLHIILIRNMREELLIGYGRQ